ncbi:MAG: flagellar biosynthesis anti-sigma factor FlgM [Burkholderiaceae bacterium]
MKIGHPADHNATAIATGGNAVAGTPAAPHPASLPAVAHESTKVELSSAAALMSTEASPEFDAAKVARMSQAITDGTFKIDAGVIADRLIANAQELLSKVPR